MPGDLRVLRQLAWLEVDPVKAVLSVLTGIGQ